MLPPLAETSELSSGERTTMLLAAWQAMRFFLGTPEAQVGSRGSARFETIPIGNLFLISGVDTRRLTPITRTEPLSLLTDA